MKRTNTFFHCLNLKFFFYLKRFMHRIFFQYSFNSPFINPANKNNFILFGLAMEYKAELNRNSCKKYPLKIRKGKLPTKRISSYLFLNNTLNSETIGERNLAKSGRRSDRPSLIGPVLMKP